MEANAVFVDKVLVVSLKRTNQLLEELLETLDVLADEKALNALRESAADKKAGRAFAFATI